MEKNSNNSNNMAFVKIGALAGFAAIATLFFTAAMNEPSLASELGVVVGLSVFSGAVVGTSVGVTVGMFAESVYKTGILQKVKEEFKNLVSGQHTPEFEIKKPEAVMSAIDNMRRKTATTTSSNSLRI
jgi:hypothetical protein